MSPLVVSDAVSWACLVQVVPVVYTYAVPALLAAPSAPISAVLASPLSDTAEPNWSAATGVGSVICWCCVQVVPVRVNA